MTEEVTPRHIAVRGTGATARKPDIAYIQVFVRCAGIWLADAVSETASKASQVVSALRIAHPAIKRICVTDALVGEAHDYSPSRTDKPQPEVVKAILIVAPPDPGLAVSIVDSASRLGCTFQNPGNRMSRMYPQNAIQYALSDPVSAEQEAMRLAVGNARSQAALLSEAASVKLGALWYVSLASPSPRRHFEREADVTWPGESLSEHKSLSAEAVTVEHTVELRFLLA